MLNVEAHQEVKNLALKPTGMLLSLAVLPSFLWKPPLSSTIQIDAN